MRVLIAQLCPTLCNPMNYSSGSLLCPWILQARVPEWLYTHTHTHTHTHIYYARTHTHTCTHAQWCANKNLAIGTSGGLRMPWFVESANFYVLNPSWWISSYNMRSENSDVRQWLSWATRIAPAHGCPMSLHNAQKYIKHRTSLVVQLLRIHLPMQGTQVLSLV